MRLLRRWAFNVLAALSLVLSIAAAAGWVRSYSTMDSTSIRHRHTAGTSVSLLQANALSTRGTIEFNIAYGTLDPGADWGAGLREGWTGSHSSSPAGRLMFHSIPAQSPIEHLGIRFVKGNPGFVGGLMSKAATHVIVDVPYAGLVAVFLVAPAIWFILRRRRRLRPGHCPRCGYDLTGNLSGKCSECGLVISCAEPGSGTDADLAAR